MAWKDLQEEKKQGGISIDGYARSPEEENKLNELVASVFAGPNGQAVINYLRSISVDAVSGPNITNEHLRHLEGMRYIVAILSRRITSHNQGGTDARTRTDKPNKRIIRTSRITK
jgi:hypothetical protein|tara:strand:+ start:1574 stop:1918 length:345 start_codon:yes stop_codon:yes gene_type:complete